MPRTRRSTTKATKLSRKRSTNKACATMSCKIAKCSSVINSCKSMVALDAHAEEIERRYEGLIARLARAVNAGRTNLFISKILEELYPVSITLDRIQRKHAAAKKTCVHGNPKGKLCRAAPFVGQSNKVGGRNTGRSRILARHSSRRAAAPATSGRPNKNNAAAARRRAVLNAIARRSR